MIFINRNREGFRISFKREIVKSQGILQEGKRWMDFSNPPPHSLPYFIPSKDSLRVRLDEALDPIACSWPRDALVLWPRINWSLPTISEWTKRRGGMSYLLMSYLSFFFVWRTSGKYEVGFNERSGYQQWSGTWAVLLSHSEERAPLVLGHPPVDRC